MSFSSGRDRGRGPGNNSSSFDGRVRHGSRSGANNQQPQTDYSNSNRPNLLKSISGDEHDRLVRGMALGDRKRPKSPERDLPYQEKRLHYDSRGERPDGNMYGNVDQKGNPNIGSMDFQVSTSEYQRNDYSLKGGPFTDSAMSTPYTSGNPSDQMNYISRGQINPKPLFPSSVQNSATTPASRPLKSILKKKSTPADSPGQIQQDSFSNRPPDGSYLNRQPEGQIYPEHQSQRTPDGSYLNRQPDRPTSDSFSEKRNLSKSRLPGMSSYMDPEDEDRFLYGEDMSKQLNSGLQKSSTSHSGMWMHPSDMTKTSDYGSSLGVQPQGGIAALSSESMSSIQAALASLKQTQSQPQSQPQAVQQSPRHLDILSVLPNISTNLLSSLNLPSANLLSGLAGQTQQSVQSQPQQAHDLLSNLSRSQTSELLSTVRQLQASQQSPKVSKPSLDYGRIGPPSSLLSESQTRMLAPVTPVRDEPKKDVTTNTIQNILQSIGFDFGMSKRMQELAKEKEEKENKVKEKDICINQTASFLGGGLSDADLTAGLFKRKDSSKVKHDTPVSKKPEKASIPVSESGQKIESILNSKRSSLENEFEPTHLPTAGVDLYNPYAQHPMYPPQIGEVPHPAYIGVQGYGNYETRGGFYPPHNIQMPPSFSSINFNSNSHKLRVDSEGFSDYDEFDQSIGSKRPRLDSKSPSSERTRSLKMKRNSLDRSPQRRDSRDISPKSSRSPRRSPRRQGSRSPRRQSPRRQGSRSPRRKSKERSPRRRGSRSPRRRGSRSPRRRGSRSPRRRGSRSPRRRGSRSPRRRSPRRRASQDRSPRRKGSRERSPRRRDTSDRSPNRNSRDNRLTHDNMTEARGQDDSIMSRSSREKSFVKEDLKSVELQETKLQDFKIQIGTSADSRRVVATSAPPDPIKEPTPEPKRIVLMPKTEHIRKITVAPKKDESKTKVTAAIPLEIRARLKKEHDDRQKKLDNLEKEMDKLKKQQNEIMRKRQKQKDGHKDPLLTANSKLQEEITEQIRILRKAADEPVDIKQYELEVKPKVEISPGSQRNYKFRDQGGHWCRCCNYHTNNVLDFCKHLKKESHQKKVDPYDRPWTFHTMKKKMESNSKGPMTVLPVSGSEFIMSVDAFYCSLCNEFMGDLTSAEAHLKDFAHFNTYKAYTSKNQFYEKRYNLEKKAKLSARKEEREQEREQEQRKETEKRSQINKEKDIKIKEKERRWDKDVIDLSDDKHVPDRRKSNTKDIKLKLVDKKEEEEEDLKGYAKFKWKKDGIKPSIKPVTLGQDEEETVEEPVIKPSGPKLFLPDSSEAHFPKPREARISAEQPKKEVNSKVKSNNSSNEKKNPIPILVGRMTRSTASSNKSKVLPSWTPVTRKIPSQKEVHKVQPLPKAEQQTKSQAETPVSLDEFLRTEKEGIKKALPVVPELNLLSIPLPPTPEAEKPIITVKTKLEIETELAMKEQKEDFKLLGIDPDSLAPLVTPKPPPPVSQNVKLPNDQPQSNMSATSASDLYKIYYENERKAPEEQAKTIKQENADATATNENNQNIEAENASLQNKISEIKTVVDEAANQKLVIDNNTNANDLEADKEGPSTTKDVKPSNETKKEIEIKSEQKNDQELESTTKSNTESIELSPEVLESVADSTNTESTKADITELDVQKTKSEPLLEPGDDSSNDSTIIVSLEDDYADNAEKCVIQCLTVTDVGNNSDEDQMAGMTVIDEQHDEDEEFGDSVTIDLNEGSLELQGYGDIGVVDESDLAKALDQFTEDASGMGLGDLDHIGGDAPLESAHLGDENSLTNTLDENPVILSENISSEGGNNVLGMTVSVIENFSEESDSNKCFDPCLADSMADESVPFVDGLSVMECAEAAEPEDTICPDEFKGISLEMPGDQEELDISDGESLGSSVEMGSDFEVVDECAEDLEGE